MDNKRSQNFEFSKHVQVESQQHKQPPALLGDCQAMRDLRQLLDEIADFDAPILLTGERGTGKSLFASHLHRKSQHREQAFVRINGAGSPPDSLERALFGHQNAANSAIAAAAGGTLYLSGIESMPLATQTKLLNLLQTGEFTSCDGEKAHKANVRIIAGTNENLAGKVQAGDFRQDLFYRLNLIEVILPPLRDRGQDILILADHFLQNDAALLDCSAVPFSKAALEFLHHYPFPGNVGELKSLLRRALILSEGQVIEPRHLQPALSDHLRAGANSRHFATAKQQVIDAFEKAFLSQRLHETGGNISQAARQSGMYKANFIEKMKRHGLRRVDFLKK